MPYSKSQMSNEERNVYINLGMRFVKLREERQISRPELAKLAGIHPQIMLDYETARKSVSFYALYKIAKAFKISVSELIEDVI